jgi:ribosomal protein S18 acetylase RimI-like enzyme
MAIHEVDYTHSEVEIEEMRALLVKSYLVSRKPFNWRLAVAENWTFASRYLEPPQYFTSRTQLWKNDLGELVGFLIRGSCLIHLQIDYQHRYLESEMLGWAERNWAGDKAQIDTMVYDWDLERQNLLKERGYKKLGAIEDVRIYDLARLYPPPNLLPGFQITSLAEYGDPQARIDLENSIWGVSLDDAWFRGKSSAPSYSPHWDLIAVSSDGKLAAQSLVWIYPMNQTAEIDPLGTHPDYRKQGLARALVLESFKRMQASGMRFAYIASESQDRIVSQLYASLQPVKTYQGYRWSKQLS